MATNKWSDIKNKMSQERKEKIDSEAKEALNNMPPIHPGEVLLKEFMMPDLFTWPNSSENMEKIGAIVLGKSSIDEDTAKWLANEYDTTTEFWLNLQKDYDSKSK